MGGGWGYGGVGGGGVEVGGEGRGEVWETRVCL